MLCQQRKEVLKALHQGDGCRRHTGALESTEEGSLKLITFDLGQAVLGKQSAKQN